MNKFVKQQLLKCTQAIIPAFDDTTTNILISRYDKADLSIMLNHWYILELADYVINEPPNFTLSSNWNNGTKPKHKYNKAEVIQIMGKMVKINCIGYNMQEDKNIPDVWEGWVPEKAIKLIKYL